MTEADVLHDLSKMLDGVNDETIARVFQQYGKKRGMPVIAYSSADVREDLLEIAGDHPNVMFGKFPRIVEDVIKSEKWQETADHAQSIVERDLYNAVSESVRKLA
jgi:hypothetical protein